MIPYGVKYNESESDIKNNRFYQNTLNMSKCIFEKYQHFEKIKNPYCSKTSISKWSAFYGHFLDQPHLCIYFSWTTNAAVQNAVVPDGYSSLESSSPTSTASDVSLLLSSFLRNPLPRFRVGSGTEPWCFGQLRRPVIQIEQWWKQRVQN